MSSFCYFVHCIMEENAPFSFCLDCDNIIHLNINHWQKKKKKSEVLNPSWRVCTLGTFFFSFFPLQAMPQNLCMC